MQFGQALSAIDNCPIFASVDPAARRNLAQTATEAHYDSGEEIVAEGEPADRMFIIAEGRADVFLRGKDGPIPVASFGPGDTFGEIALLTKDGVRTASVRAAVPLAALTISRADLQALLACLPAFAGKLEQLRDEMLAQNFLKLSTPFGSLDAKKLRAFVQRLSRRAVTPGETIIRQGERGEHAYLIRTGRVDVVLEGNGPEQHLTSLGAGSLIGELALLSDAPRNATVRAQEACDLFVLRREDLLWAIDQNSEIGEALHWMLNSRDRPQRVEGIEAHRRETADGAMVTVLKDPSRSTYYRLSEQGWFVWQRFDGRHTFRMLTVAYFSEFKSFAPAVIAAIVADLAAAGFVQTRKLDLPVMGGGYTVTGLQRAAVAAARLLDCRIAFGGVDNFFGALYRRGGHILFSRSAQVLFGVCALAGFVALFMQTPRAIALLPHLAGLRLLWTLPIIAAIIVLHEMGHALAVKAFGRQVPRAGIGWHWIGPIAFVDTSDMWIEGRRPRVVVDFAGIWTNSATGGLAALAAIWVDSPTPFVLLWLFALLSFATAVVNANPLLDYDGYYVFSDWFDRPKLRSEALSRVGALVSGKSAWADAPTARQADLFYVLASTLSLATMAGLTFAAYRLFLQNWVASFSTPSLANMGGGLLVAIVVALMCLPAASDVLERTSGSPKRM